MDAQTHKCPSCRKAYRATKISQVYCSAKCRQAAYRKRQRQKIPSQKRREEQPLILLICNHCTGTFLAKRDTARFCSTSCRTLYHRALRAAIPKALMDAYGLPAEKAMDIIETQPIHQLKLLLKAVGLIYCHPARHWIPHLKQVIE